MASVEPVAGPSFVRLQRSRQTSPERYAEVESETLADAKQVTEIRQTKGDNLKWKIIIRCRNDE